jgi:hypothetical protein
MDLLTIKPPAPRIALARQTLKLRDAALRIIPARQLLQVVANRLIQALPHGFRLLAGTGDELLINGKGDIHYHSLRVHVFRVNNGWRILNKLLAISMCYS